jgi:CHAT domain-containing protein/tetratricopeptide (TPR) repeat protein
MRRVLIALFLIQSMPAQDAAALTASANRKYQAHDLDGAIRDYQQALAGLPEGRTSAEAGDVLVALSTVLYAKADYAAAKARAQEAIEILQPLDGRQSSLAGALAAEATAMLGAGDYQAANPIFERALALAEKDPGPEDRKTILIRERFSVNLTRAGQYARAKVMQEQVLSTAERRLGDDDPLTAQTLDDLGQLLVEMGDYPTSMQYQLRALHLVEVRAGKTSEPVGNTLIGMGNNAINAADYLNAKAYFERAAGIYESLLGPNSTKLGGALDNLGQALTHMRHFQEARPVLERALAIQTASLGPRHPWTANVLQSLALLEAGLGNYEKAGEDLTRNLEIWSEVLGPEHPFTTVSLTIYGDVLAHQGKYGEALATALKAADIRRDNIVRTVRTIDERQGLRYAALHTTSMDTALTIASRADASTADRARTWDALIRSRALVLDEMSARHRSIRQSPDTEVAALERKVAADRGQITKLILQGPGKLALAEYSKQLDAARTQWEQAGTQLAVKSAAFRSEWNQQRTGYAEIAAALPSGSALVAYRRYRRKNYAAAGDAATDSYLAFVLPGPGRDPMVVSLGDAAIVDGLVAKWRGEIDRERGSLGRSALNNETQYRAVAGALRQAVWDPVQRRLGSAARVYLVPDGTLQLVNFDALPAAAGGYLVESAPLLHMLAAERDLAATAAPRTGSELLLVADPQFENKPSPSAPATSNAYRGPNAGCADFASMQFSRLPGSMPEAQAIAHIWNAEGWHATTLSGVRANEAELKDDAPGKRVVHIATHGFFLASQCPGSEAARENPLLRSGLALAGANLRQSARAGQDDGILTAEEAAGLDLDDTEWVVLSGCDTGLGDVKAGEGLLGLRRAFQEAGARTLIASLWPVDDNDTRDWMTNAYRARFHAGKGTAESVREADMSQLRARRKAGKSTHPFYWAGFVAVGD